LKAPP
jgi:peptide/nickel transport system ATP-binding protein